MYQTKKNPKNQFCSLFWIHPFSTNNGSFFLKQSQYLSIQFPYSIHFSFNFNSTFFQYQVLSLSLSRFFIFPILPFSFSVYFLCTFTAYAIKRIFYSRLFYSNPFSILIFLHSTVLGFCQNLVFLFNSILLWFF